MIEESRYATLQASISEALPMGDIDIPIQDEIFAVADIRDIRLKSLPPLSVTLLESAIRNLRQDNKLEPILMKNKEGEVPAFRITEIVDKKGAEGKTAIVYLAGILGTGPHTATIGTEMFMEGKRIREEMHNAGGDPNLYAPEVGLVLGVSSSVSVDTMNEPYPSVVEVRAGYQVAGIAELLVKHKVKDVIFVGYSLGAVDGAFAVPIYREFMNKIGHDIPVRGLIMPSPGGQMDQSLLRVLLRSDIQALVGKDLEIEERFPSILTIHALQDAFDHATETHDEGARHKIMQELDRVKKFRENPDLYKTHLKTTDAAIDTAWYSQDLTAMKKLLSYRAKILRPYIEKTSIGPDRRPFTIPAAIVRRLRHARVAFRGIPEYILHATNVPIVRVWAGKDPLFQHPSTRRTLLAIQEGYAPSYREKQIKPNTSGVVEYPSAPVVIDVNVSLWAHMSTQTNRKRFAQIAFGAIHQMTMAHNRYNQVHKAQRLEYTI